MIIKEKRYIKKCDCGTEIIYTRRDCYHNTTWDIYSLYCPSCSHEYSYRRGTHHDLFDKEYEEDSVDKDEEIERLKRRLEEYQEYVEINHKEIERLKKDNKYLNKVNIELSTEKNRLNNIINELEKWLEKEQDRLARETSNIYEDSLGKTRLVNENIYEEVQKIKDKLQELKGSDKNCVPKHIKDYINNLLDKEVN